MTTHPNMRETRRKECMRLAVCSVSCSASELAGADDASGTAAKWASEIHAATMKEHRAEGRHKDRNRTRDLEVGAEELARMHDRVRHLRGELVDAIAGDPDGSMGQLVRGVAAQLTERTFTDLARLVTSRALPAAQCVASRVPEGERAVLKATLERRTGEVLHHIGIMRELFGGGPIEAARWMVGLGTTDAALLAVTSLFLELAAVAGSLGPTDDVALLLRALGRRTKRQLADEVRSTAKAAEHCVFEGFMGSRALHPAVADVARAVAESLQDRLIVGRGAKQVPDAATWTRLGQALRRLQLVQQPLGDLF